MPAPMNVCQGRNCTRNGSPLLLRDLEDLAFGCIDVKKGTCMRKCGAGPNVKIGDGDGEDVVKVTGLRTFEDIENLLRNNYQGVQIKPLRRNLGEIKFRIRREQDFEKRREALEEGFGLIEGKDDDPRLRSEMLVLRSHHFLETAAESSCTDALAAVDLAPGFTEAHLAVSDALVARDGQNSSAVAALNKALSSTVFGLNKDAIRKKVEDLENMPTTTTTKSEVQGPMFREWRVQTLDRINHNCVKITLQAVSPVIEPPRFDMWHVDVKATPSSVGKEVVRPYTPLSSKEDYKNGTLTLLLKVYEKGAMTPHLAQLGNVDVLQISTPVQTLDVSEYSRGVAVVAGGSAITVALQILEAVSGSHPQSQVRAIVCYSSMKDILCHERLEALHRKCQNFKLAYQISEGVAANQCKDQGWVRWDSGRVTREALMRIPSDLKAIVSGPSAMCDTVGGALQKLGLEVVPLDGDPANFTDIVDDDDSHSNVCCSCVVS